jgi:hypothetical protein
VILEVHNHIWDCGGNETDVSQGQIGQEEIHRSVEVGVPADGQDDEQVPKHCHNVHGKKHPKENRLQLWIL